MVIYKKLALVNDAVCQPVLLVAQDFVGSVVGHLHSIVQTRRLYRPHTRQEENRSETNSMVKMGKPKGRLGGGWKTRLVNGTGKRQDASVALQHKV